MKRSCFMAWLSMVAFVLGSCSSRPLIVRWPEHVRIARAYKNPHTDCAHCHGVAAPVAGKALFPPDVDPSKYCLDCHNYGVNHHPVDVSPAAPPRSAFPLYNGRVTCLTCHDIHGGPEHKGFAGLLRGGPYEDQRKICFDCHTPEQYANLDPHVMKDESGNHVVINGRPVCVLCHEVEPDPSQDKANTVLFRADVSFLCLRCHTLMHGDFFEKHFLVAPSREIVANMNRPEIRENFSLPLVPRGRITCSTCHNPHEEGIITYGPAAAGAGSPHRLRSETICYACHG